MDVNNSLRVASNEIIKQLQSVRTTPCISLYMTTHKHHPDNQKDPINYKNLLKRLEESLLNKYTNDEVKQYLASFYELLDDRDFWNNTSSGLAIFGAGKLFNIVMLHEPVNELAVVANSFHTKPLRMYLQSVYRYQILGVSLHSAILFEGTRHSLKQVNLPDQFPDDIKKALGSELTEDHLTVASYGGAGRQNADMYHGHGGNSPEKDKDAERYFRVVADAVHEKYSKNDKLPLILAALTEHHSVFQKVNKNPYLLKEGLQINPFSLQPDELADLAWRLLEPEYNRRIEEIKEHFSLAQSKGVGSDMLRDVMNAAKEGRVGTILIEADKIVADEYGDKSAIANLLNDPEKDDMLDDIGELVFSTGGEVIVIPAEMMPTTSGVAAIYRY